MATSDHHGRPYPWRSVVPAVLRRAGQPTDLTAYARRVPRTGGGHGPARVSAESAAPRRVRNCQGSSARPEATLLTWWRHRSWPRPQFARCFVPARRLQCTSRVRSSTRGGSRTWADVRPSAWIEADTHRSADTTLLRYPLPATWCERSDVALYPHGNRPTSPEAPNTDWRVSLFLYGLCSKRADHRGHRPWWRPRPGRRRCPRRSFSPTCWDCPSSR